MTCKRCGLPLTVPAGEPRPESQTGRGYGGGDASLSNAGRRGVHLEARKLRGPDQIQIASSPDAGQGIGGEASPRPRTARTPQDQGQIETLVENYRKGMDRLATIHFVLLLLTLYSLASLIAWRRGDPTWGRNLALSATSSVVLGIYTALLLRICGWVNWVIAVHYVLGFAGYIYTLVFVVRWDLLRGLLLPRIVVGGAFAIGMAVGVSCLYLAIQNVISWGRLRRLDVDPGERVLPRRLGWLGKLGLAVAFLLLPAAGFKVFLEKVFLEKMEGVERSLEELLPIR